MLPGCDSGSASLNGDGGGSGGPDGGGSGFADADPFAPDGSGCPAVHVSLTPVTPTVLLLLDQSGSMTATFGNSNRWDAMRAALIDPTTGVVSQLQDSVIFGATLYTSNNGGPTCPVLTTVAPAISNFTAINNMLAPPTAPEDDTPTGASIMGAKGILDGVAQDPDAPPSPKIIVLATDGEPDTCAVPDPQTQAGKDEAIAAAKAAFAGGIRLFILSVGNEVGAAHQQDMANAGAGKPIGGTDNAPYYTADNPAQLRAAFDQIINGVRECTFALSGTVDPAQAASGTVKLDDQPLIFNDPNGWALKDPTTLELKGTACTTFLQDASVSLTAEFPCGVVIP